MHKWHLPIFWFYDTLPSLVIFLWHDYPDRRWCFEALTLPQALYVCHFTCIFKLMNLSSVLNGGSLIKSILWQFSSDFKAFDVIKTTFGSFQKFFRKSKTKYIELCSKQGNCFHLLLWMNLDRFRGFYLICRKQLNSFQNFFDPDLF